MVKTVFFILLKIFMFSGLMFPNEGIRKIVDLEQLLIYGEKNSLELGATYDNWRSLVQLSDSTGFLPDPSLSLSFFINPIETRTGPQKMQLGIKQVFPWFGKLKLKRKKSLYRANVYWAKYQEQRLSFRYKIKKTLYELDFVNSQRGIKMEMMELLMKSGKSLESRFINRQVPYSGILKVETEKDRLKEELKNLEDLKVNLNSKLRALLNLQSHAHIPVVTLPSSVKYSSKEDFIKDGEKLNPRVMAYKSLLEAEKTGVSIAMKDFWPDPGLGVRYIVNGSRSGVFPDNGKDPFGISLSFNLPLNRSRLKAAVYSAKKLEEAADKRKENYLNTLRVEIEEAFLNVGSSYRNITLYKSRIVPRGEQLRDIALREWENGSGDIDDYLDACRVWLEFRLNYLKYLKKNRLSVAKLLMLSGKEVSL